MHLALYGAVMISYPRPKAVAVAVPADYHGNQAVLTAARVVVALPHGGEMKSYREDW